ncbi:MAG: hypothetical protein Q9196_003244 [Gyalolechia fulgens]
MTPAQHDSSSLHETQTSPPDEGSASSRTASVERKDSLSSPRATWQKISDVLFYTPKRCRYNPANPPKFSTGLNLLFAFAGAFTVANLYYNHPILHLLAEDFNVSNERASLIPTLAQAGYASGLVFLCPLGDVFPRRLFVVSLVLFTATACHPSTEYVQARVLLLSTVAEKRTQCSPWSETLPRLTAALPPFRLLPPAFS